MTTPQKFWLVDATGTKALVEGETERDRFLPLGWALADEPAGREFFWARCEGVAKPARFTLRSFAASVVRGWRPGAPPHPLDGAEPPAPAPKPVTDKKSAVGGNAKEN